MTVKVATDKDLPIVADLLDEFWKTHHPGFPYDPEFFLGFLSRNLENDRLQVLLLNDGNGLMINCLTMSEFCSLPAAREMVWYTRPEARGRGLSLYRRFCKWAKAHGAGLMVCTLGDKTPGMERLGFRMSEVGYYRALT